MANVPSGYHFTPSRKELVKSYLRRRLLNKPLPSQAIKELNIYDFHPRDILVNTRPGKHLYFFSPRRMKYPNGSRPDRGTNEGYWKASCDMIIKDKKKKEIGRKMTLVFYEGRQSNGKKTNWLMQEYTIKDFWFPTNRNKNELGALAVCEIYQKPTLNQSRAGEPQVDEEEEGSTSDSSDDEDKEDNIFDDQPVRSYPRSYPAQSNHGNDRGKAPITSSNGCPSTFRPTTARPGPSTVGNNNGWGHNMVLIPESSLRPRDYSISSSHQMRPLPTQCQPSYVACPSSLGNAGGLLQLGARYLPDRNMMPMSDLKQPKSLIHSFYCPCVAPAFLSSQFRNLATPSFRNHLMSPSQQMPYGEMPSSQFGVAAASSSQYQRPPPPRIDSEARQLMPSAFGTVPQTTLWPPRHLS